MKHFTFQEPDPSKLTREYLIHTSSITTAENAVTLLTQTALALQHADTEYREVYVVYICTLSYTHINLNFE